MPPDYFLWWGIPGLDTLAAGVMILMVLARSSPSQLNTLLSKSARLSTFLNKGVQKVDPGIQKFWEMIENQDENLPISEDLIAADVKLVDIHLNDQPFFRFESRLSAFRCASISWFQVVSQLVSEWYFSDFQ